MAKGRSFAAGGSRGLTYLASGTALTCRDPNPHRSAGVRGRRPHVLSYSLRMRSQEDRDEQTILIARVVFVIVIGLALTGLASLALDWLFE